MVRKPNFWRSTWRVSVFQREDCGIEVGLFGIPELGALDHEVYLCSIAVDGKGLALSHLHSVGIDNIDAYRTARHRPVQKDVCHKSPVTLGIDGHPMDVL